MISMVMIMIANRTLVSVLDTEWVVVAGTPPRYNSLPPVSTVSMDGAPMMRQKQRLVDHQMRYCECYCEAWNAVSVLRLWVNEEWMMWLKPPVDK